MTFRINSLVRVSAGLLAALVVSACASEPTKPGTGSGFGDSVRHVVEAQKANPEASRNPDPNAIDHGDGVRLEPVLEAYRTDTGTPAKVERDILIDVSK